MALQKNNGGNGLDQQAAKMLAAILTASGEPIGEVGIRRSGEQITLPEGMEIPEAITWLQRKDREENTVFPLGAARALSLAVKKRFGFSQVSDFWPTSVGLEVDAQGNTEQVYIGKFQVPTIDGAIGKNAGLHMATALSNLKNGSHPYHGEAHEAAVMRPNG